MLACCRDKTELPTCCEVHGSRPFEMIVPCSIAQHYIRRVENECPLLLHFIVDGAEGDLQVAKKALLGDYGYFVVIVSTALTNINVYSIKEGHFYRFFYIFQFLRCEFPFFIERQRDLDYLLP